MAVNLSGFTDEINAMKRTIVKEMAKEIRDVVSEIFKALLDPKEMGGTPKVTGWLRSNYLVVRNTPRGRTVGSKESVNTLRREFLFERLLATSDAQLVKSKSIHIENNVPYIEEVNYGTANTPPQNFIERAIQKGLAKTNRIRVVR